MCGNRDIETQIVEQIFVISNPRHDVAQAIAGYPLFRQRCRLYTASLAYTQRIGQHSERAQSRFCSMPQTQAVEKDDDEF